MNVREAVRRLMNTLKVDGLTRALTRQLVFALFLSFSLGFISFASLCLFFLCFHRFSKVFIDFHRFASVFISFPYVFLRFS